MTDHPAVFRAELGAALRALPSELLHQPRQPRRKTRSDVLALARDLENASPGLALMMQLRARLFLEAIREVGRREFEQLVTIGCGYEPRCLRRHADSLLRIIEVEHPAVLARDDDEPTQPGGFIRVPASDFERGTWEALTERGASPRDYQTFVLLQGLSLWGSTTAFAYWLDRLSEAVPGREMLLNVLDGDGVAYAQRAGSAMHTLHGAASVTIQCGIERARLVTEIDARGLELVRLFDSRDIQQKYLGTEDLLVHELYVWVRAFSGDAAAPPCTGLVRRETVPSRAGRMSAHRAGSRPRLRSGLRLDTDGTVSILRLPITALRASAVRLAPSEIAAASLFDGTHSIADSAETLARCGVRYLGGEVWDVARLLRTHGFLEARTHSHLGALRELAFSALHRGDDALAHRVAGLLAPFAGNRAAEHLRTLLQSRRSRAMVFAPRSSIAVVAPEGSTLEQGREILAATHDILRAAACLLDVRFSGGVVIDVSAVRAAIPVAVVSDAEPYTPGTNSDADLLAIDALSRDRARPRHDRLRLAERGTSRVDSAHARAGTMLSV